MSVTENECPSTSSDNAVQWHLAQLQLQTDATWKTLDAATQSRDQLLRFHGGFLIALPVVIGLTATEGHQLSPQDATLIVLAGAMFLALTSALSVRATCEFRMLQFQQDAAAAASKQLLMTATGERTYFQYSSWVRPLNRLIGRLRHLPMPPKDDPYARRTNCPQRDPMAFACSTIQYSLLIDLVVAAGLAAYVGTVEWGWVSFGRSTALVNAVATVVGIIVGGTGYLATELHVARRERDVERAIDRTWQEMNLLKLPS